MIYYISKEAKNENSSASYNHIRLICNGLKECGAKVEMFLLYLPAPRSRIGVIISRYIISYIEGVCKLLRLLFKVDKKDIVIFYGEYDQSWMFSLFGKKTNLVIERTEYPSFEIYDTLGRLGTYYSKRFLSNLKYASLLITCSSSLKNYYKKYVDDIFVIPLVVDDKEFEINNTKKREEVGGEYIAYCGSFNNNKDGIPILIEAFSLFHVNHPLIRLVLIGTGSQDNVINLKRYVKQFGIERFVVFTGAVPHEEIGPWLCGASMLALARPNNKQAEGGIPSKVGEYLASGVPCVITRTGDLPNYLHDGVDCFICEPDSASAFAKRLEDCYISDKKEIGRMARLTVKQMFGYRYQAKRLMEFFNQKY